MRSRGIGRYPSSNMIFLSFSIGVLSVSTCASFFRLRQSLMPSVPPPSLPRKLAIGKVAGKHNYTETIPTNTKQCPLQNSIKSGPSIGETIRAFQERHPRQIVAAAPRQRATTREHRRSHWMSTKNPSFSTSNENGFHHGRCHIHFE
jgi:hypothetical protein